MPRPRFCRNLACAYAYRPPPNWLARAGTYFTIAHGTVQRYRCKRCGKWMGNQTESMHYYAKRRLDLAEILSRVRGGSSLRDIGRELGCSRTAVANAVIRLGRQAMASHVELVGALDLPGEFVFDGLVSAVTSHDYPSQIQTLVDRSVELVLAMTHYVGERGGTRTANQRKRIKGKRAVWNPRPGALAESIRLLVNELPRFAGLNPITIDTDENPLYVSVIEDDLAMRWYRHTGRLKFSQTPSTSPRTTGNPLFPVNYVDRMIRHRIKEHTRESIAVGRNSTMQMLRMWIFAWDNNVRQPYRVNDLACSCRAIEAGVSEEHLGRLTREFYTRRRSLRRRRVPESMQAVWLSRLDTPPVRWRKGQRGSGPVATNYARVDLAFADLQGQ
jgi:hypothetical protein